MTKSTDERVCSSSPADHNDTELPTYGESAADAWMLFSAGGECAQRMHDKRRSRANNWEQKHPGARYGDYLALRAPGLCYLCPRYSERRSYLCADEVDGALVGVVCGRHLMDLRAVRAGNASAIGPLVHYLAGDGR